MTVYHGVVKGNRVELTEPADLPDGTEVEVRPTTAPTTDAEARAREDAFLRHLFEIGLIRAIPSREARARLKTPKPVEIIGPPLSETIIEERR